MDKKEAEELLDKYLKGTCTPEEKKLLESIDNKIFKQELDSSGHPDYEAIKAAIYLKLPKPVRQPIINRLAAYTIAAAILVMALAATLYFHSGLLFENTKKTNEIKPGGNKAVLTLGDGTKVELDSAQNGIIISSGEIKYSNGNNVLAGKSKIPGAPGAHRAELTTYNSVATPRGGQYQVLLSDGTKVWLNSQSILKYPSKFTGDRREVELIGEAYFEVNNNPTVGERKANPNAAARVPFIVRTKNQETIVLGTEFNLTAFGDEPTIKTTLVSGAIQVASQAGVMTNERLYPGQQAINANGKIQVNIADIKSTIAWKSGNFYFKNTPFQEMIMQIARWYDIEVVYKSTIPNETFSGDMTRNVSLMTVLDLLKISDIHYHVEGKKLFIE